MAYLEVPSIGVTLPICHGTETSTLQKAVGHLEWSSLPVGGSSTHCVLSGHRGLPSSELLTNLDHLEYGDAFYLHVLGDTLEYRVDRVTIVEPGDFQLLGIEEGKDYVTLITCTPYGINSHRLAGTGRAGRRRSARLRRPPPDQRGALAGHEIRHSGGAAGTGGGCLSGFDAG